VTESSAPGRLISVIIPVRNGGEALRRCLDGIERQEVDEEVEVVIVDSSSTDGSAELARVRGARVEVIPVERFNHGATRNLGALLARGDTLVFTTQDAHAADARWLARLTAPLRDEGVAGVYGRQLAHDDATPPERYFLDFLYGGRGRVQAAASRVELSMDTTLFSNVNAAIPRRLWERFPFADDIVMSEDQEWACRVLLAGYSLVYEPAAVVRHSHAYTLRSAFRRFFDSGASAERAYLAGARPAGRALMRNALRYLRGEAAWLRRTRQLRWVPYTLLYEAVKFCGLQLGARHRWLPPQLKARLSALPSYWLASGEGAAARGSRGRTPRR
jgi:rhamnosyltransferase